jgi:hypothetical protein
MLRAVEVDGDVAEGVSELGVVDEAGTLFGTTTFAPGPEESETERVFSLSMVPDSSEGFVDPSTPAAL